METLLSSNELMKYLRISKPTLLKYLHDGRIVGKFVGKQWMFLESDIMHFLRKEPPNPNILDDVNLTPEQERKVFSKMLVRFQGMSEDERIVDPSYRLMMGFLDSTQRI